MSILITILLLILWFFAYAKFNMTYLDWWGVISFGLLLAFVTSLLFTIGAYADYEELKDNYIKIEQLVSPCECADIENASLVIDYNDNLRKYQRYNHTFFIKWYVDDRVDDLKIIKK